jgi:ribulose-5-phosphate 4-epimerase/fuculose-1-phosphate aldolase
MTATRPSPCPAGQGRLTPDDIMVVDFDGQPVAAALRPSAETLHTRLYRRFAEVGCVLHTHSPVQTIASRLYAAQGHVRLQGYEAAEGAARQHHPRHRARPAGVPQHRT